MAICVLYHVSMPHRNYEERRRIEALPPEELARHQLARLNALLAKILPTNRFYADKLAGLDLPLVSLEQLLEIPFTFKDELAGSHDSGDLPANLTYPPEDYLRFHQTSGTRGRPMIVLDTAEDWQWWIGAWQYVLDVASVGPGDRCMLAFSFGPFIGFWSAFDAAAHRGALVVPTGGMSTLARLEMLRNSQATVLFCTPTYALHMAEKGRDHQIDVSGSAVRAVIVAGEPGGSVPAIRQRIESAFGAKLIDHAGATEIGPWGYAHLNGSGLHVNEDFFHPEFLSVETGKPAGEGELAELVLTSLGRAGAPVIRYRTRDLVRPSWNCAGANNFVLLQGGVLGRADDMMVIRGVNIFPSSVEQILRSIPEVVEYRMTAMKHGEMDALQVEVEDRLEQPARIEREVPRSQIEGRTRRARRWRRRRR